MYQWPGLARLCACGTLVSLCVLAGLGALLSAASWTARPVLFLAAGWAVFALGVVAALRRSCVPGRRWRVTMAWLAALSAVGAAAVLWPDAGITPPQLVPGTHWVRLPGGERLAYLELPATRPAHATPVIFLHGGPGMADMGGDAVYLRRLAADGYDVYLYDQLGVGESSRLANPAHYTVAGSVANLESFRKAIHAPQVDLIGYSWGSALAAAYLASHAHHVSKVVFVSPGAVGGQASDLLELLGRLGPAHLWALLRQTLAPRAMLAWMLVQVNPRAAHAFAGDAEMDARFRDMIAAFAPAFYCHPPARTSGGHPGFYALAMLLRRQAWRGVDPHAALRRLATPALILKGQCDYLSWASAVDYRDTLRNARLVYVPNAGHRLFAEQPRAFAATVSAFLDGHPLPMAAMTRRRPPPGYDGPAGTVR